MIVLPSISQNVYIIDDTRYSCYNNYENREIAKMLLSEEYANLRVTNLQLQVDNISDLNKELRKELTSNDKVINSYEELITKYESSNNEVIDKYNKLNAKMEKYKPYVISSIALNIVLIGIIIVL